MYVCMYTYVRTRGYHVRIDLSTCTRIYIYVTYIRMGVLCTRVTHRICRYVCMCSHMFYKHIYMCTYVYTDVYHMYKYKHI